MKSEINSRSQTETDIFYMSLAFAERLTTDDPKGKIVLQSAVGAVITKNGLELTRSANVLPPELKTHMETMGKVVSEDDRYYLIEHAERAAIYKAIRINSNIAGSTIYCTRFPCSDCARAIVFAGIKRAVLAGGFAGERRWMTSQRAALKILRDGGITIRYLRQG